MTKTIPELKIAGTYRRDRHGNLDLPPATPAMPRWLSADAKRHWKATIKDLAATGALALVDQAVLASHCEALANYVLLKDQVAKEGFTGVGANGVPVANPAVRLMYAAFDRVNATAKQLGMSPVARNGIRVPEKQTRAQSKLAKYLK